MVVERYEVVKVEEVDAEGVVEKVASAWMENLQALKKAHPRVFKKVVKEILTYTNENELDQALIRVAEELLERHRKNRNLQSVKIALTYSKYLHFRYGSLVKLYLDGTITYASRATIEGYGFVVHGGMEVA